LHEQLVEQVARVRVALAERDATLVERDRLIVELSARVLELSTCPPHANTTRAPWTYYASCSPATRGCRPP